MQSLNWYLNRLSLMSPGELVWRLRGLVVNRMQVLRPREPMPSADRRSIPRAVWSLDSQAVSAREHLEAAERILRGEVDLFGGWLSADSVQRLTGEASRVQQQPGHAIDYRDQRIAGDARAVWEINRHFQFVMLAQAWLLSGERRYRDGVIASLSSWLRENPYPRGINWTSALESGIRLISWYLADRLLDLHSEARLTHEAWLASIYRHCSFIWSRRSRYSSANNHLIGEMAGLYVAATAWPCWPSSARWRDASKHILEREAERQVHEDGVTREQTVCYQVFVLQFLILAGLVGETRGDGFSRQYWSRIREMIVFLRSIADVAGQVPDFGDSDEGMVLMLSPSARRRRLEDLFAIEQWFDHPDAVAASSQSAAWWLQSGFPVPRHWSVQPGIRRSAFPEGGYFVLGRDFGTNSEVIAVMDAGPLGYLSIAAHGHADCLSFTLSVAGRTILIDPGTYCYHSEPEWRDYFRGTAAHNTLRVDARDQSEIGGAFMWLRRANATVESYELEGFRQHVRARHDGYRRLSDPVVHRRELALDLERSRIEVEDDLSCKGSHVVERNWHFADDCVVEQTSSGDVVIRSGPVVVTLHCADGDVSILRGSIQPRSGWISRRFGARSPTTTVRIESLTQGSARLSTTFTWTLRS